MFYSSNNVVAIKYYFGDAMREITFALAGNPNAGKTTVFNALTGARQHVGNYPGVTVEKKEGTLVRNGVRFNVVDLPGTYSLSANSPEEVVARNYLVMDKPDLVVQVVDASNLERNLYLATQIMELGLPLVIALNMADVAKARGIEYDLGKMQAHLRVPVIPTVGSRREGMNELLDAVLAQADKPVPEYQKITYPKELEKPVAEIDAALAGPDRLLADRYPPKWVASRLFENDPELIDKIADKTLLGKIAGLREIFNLEQKNVPEVRVAEAKYGWVAGLAADCVHMTPEANVDVSDRIDKVLLHPLFGLPIFLVMMYLMFQLVFTLAEKPMEWIEEGFAVLGHYIAGLWPAGAESPLKDLLVDGVIGGVGGVLVFLPNILLLFLAIAFLEGTGYMARAAFIMDRMMSRIGLHGKSFIPMLLGFGCSVPAIMATRTLENWRDRLTTILVIPFMSCGARLPIYSLIIPAFFPDTWRAPMLWVIYLIGILFAVVAAKLLRNHFFKGENVPFVMELPSYRMPTFTSVILLMWERAREYVKKAGTIILGASIILWALAEYPKLPEKQENTAAAAVAAAPEAGGADEAAEEHERGEAAERLAYSYTGRIGRFMEPVLRPLGFDWRIATAIIGSFAAKEVFVAQMGIVYAVGEWEGDAAEETLREKLRSHYTPLQAFCMMLYCLLSMPCIATLAVARKETGGWKYPLLMLAGYTMVAYVVTLLVYQAGSVLVG